MKKACQAVIVLYPSGDKYVYLMRKEICEEFDFCCVCEEENGNNVIAVFKVESIVTVDREEVKL